MHVLKNDRLISIWKYLENFWTVYKIVSINYTFSTLFSTCTAKRKCHHAQKYIRFVIPIHDAVFIRLVRYLVQFLTIYDNQWRFVLVPAGSIEAARDINVTNLFAEVV